ncbi:Interferon-induced GTP-binding protein Mx1 [Rhynchospora pubera]|uniref:Interferon-induced GTP-binding protein Mx1 n=1 Tax=Rhynchospora pubera TaxID=906938 RepID=A0AAV8GS64_9POAL|nr:Interferon-induced GTP-binding protein Mx1 [Rhynchospora pubera]
MIARERKGILRNEGSNALASSYNNNIRPLLDAIDQLRNLNVTQEGIQLPTIVVVGDQSSGKSSVLESLAGISLPRGQGICTRVPLIMRLKGDSNTTKPSLHLEYGDKIVQTSESGIAAAISKATVEIAGEGKGISDKPITLVVKKKSVPDLTLIDLPGITRVPAKGQPNDIYEQISKIIMEYIAPKESIILNVLSATVDFPTCESIRMSRQVDQLGERNLAVVTKSDKAPEGLLEKVMMDDVHIGLGYVCVRNRVGDETYEQARVEEERLFKSHPMLSQIDKSMIGIPVLADRLTQIQASLIAKCLPDIVQKIDDKLNRSTTELNSMPQNLSTVADAMKALIHIQKLVRKSLENLLIRGEFDELNPDDYSLHGTARITDMLHEYRAGLPKKCPTTDEEFLMEEVRVIQETKGIRLPNFMPRSAFLTLLKNKVDTVSSMPREFVNNVWEYIEKIAIQMMLRHCENYPQIKSAGQKAIHGLIDKMRDRSFKFVKDMIEMELVSDYTSNPDYKNSWVELMKEESLFMHAIEDHSQPSKISLEAFGTVEVGHLRRHVDVAEQAFDIRMTLMAYWKTIVLRLVDGVALHILHAIKCLVEDELEKELINELVGPKMPGIEKMLEESPVITAKRDRLKKSVELLKQSKDLIASIMDRVVTDGDI